MPFSFESKQKRRAKQLQRLRKQRIQAQAIARLSKLQQKEMRKIKTARNATKSGNVGLVSWGRKTLNDPKNKRIIKKLKKEFYWE